MRFEGSRRALTVAAEILAVTALAAGCREKKAVGAGAAPPPMPVEIAQATRGDVRETLHALGTIEAAERVKVTAEIDAIARQLPFDEGRLVGKGQVLADLRRGAGVTVTTVAFPGKQFTGSVNVVDPILDPTTRSARLTAVIPNPSGELRPGMSADVNAVLAERPQAVTVPDEAVFAEGDRNFVFVVRPDSTVVRRAVKLGARQPGRVEIAEGLQGGEKVVRAGHQKLFEGAKVSAVESAAATGPAPSPAAGAGTKP